VNGMRKRTEDLRLMGTGTVEIVQRKVRERKGFTLLEVIIVLSLITLILGLSSVYFAGFLPRVKFEATGREMAALVRHARSLARLNGAMQKVIIDLDGRTYGREGQIAKPIPPDVLIRIIDPVSGEVRQGRYSLLFPPSGGIAGGAIILSRGKKSIRIDMDPITGAVLMKDG
jgi:general secretion pathway protein H